MNYGRKQTKRKIKAVNSKSQKYFNKVGISFFKACFVFILFAIVTGVGAGIGAFMIFTVDPLKAVSWTARRS